VESWQRGGPRREQATWLATADSGSVWIAQRSAEHLQQQHRALTVLTHHRTELFTDLTQTLTIIRSMKSHICLQNSQPFHPIRACTNELKGDGANTCYIAFHSFTRTSTCLYTCLPYCLDSFTRSSSIPMHINNVKSTLYFSSSSYMHLLICISFSICVAR